MDGERVQSVARRATQIVMTDELPGRPRAALSETDAFEL
jgi:hypothetical protein